jgi:hypothetical protein
LTASRRSPEKLDARARLFQPARQIDELVLQPVSIVAAKIAAVVEASVPLRNVRRVSFFIPFACWINLD